MKIALIAAVIASFSSVACAGPVDSEAPVTGTGAPLPVSTSGAVIAQPAPDSVALCPQPRIYTRASAPQAMYVGNPYDLHLDAAVGCDPGDVIVTGGCSIQAAAGHSPRLLGSRPMGGVYGGVERPTSDTWWQCEATTDVSDVGGPDPHSTITATVVCSAR